MSLLIDADFIVYKCCASTETEIDYGEDLIVVTSSFSDAYGFVQRELYKIASDIGVYDYTILFFSYSVNFRKTVDTDYKGHRNRKKPCGYKRVINALKLDYPVIQLPTLEADDAMGIWATKEPGNIICSPDKDMRQIPGDLYDMSTGVVTITKEEGFNWHLIQTMAGDQTDGYAGVPGIGIKRAVALLEADGYTWETVLQAFLDKGLTEDDALRNARLAKILQNDDYDHELQQPKLWTPTTPSNGVDDGTTVQAEKD